MSRKILPILASDKADRGSNSIAPGNDTAAQKNQAATQQSNEAVLMRKIAEHAAARGGGGNVALLLREMEQQGKLTQEDQKEIGTYRTQNNNRGIAAPKVTTSGGYYSRPTLWERSEQLYDYAASLEPAYTEKRNALETVLSGLEQAQSDLEFWERHIQSLAAAYNSNPSERYADLYNRARNSYDQFYDAYSSTYDAYKNAYDDYAYTEHQYTNAVKAYQNYTQDQQAAFDYWRGTIRDAAAIEEELSGVKDQIQKLEGLETLAKAGAFLGKAAQGVAGSSSGLIANDLQRPGGASEELGRLRQLRDLLQEELDWSRHYFYDDYTKARDFGAKSKYAPTANGLEPVFNSLAGVYTETGFDDLTYDYINRNPDARTRATVSSIGNNTAFLGLDKSYLQKMTDDEIAIFNYLYATQGADAAYQYTAYLTKDLNRRRRMEQEEKWAKYAQEHPLGSSAFTVLTSPLKGISYLAQGADLAAGGDIDPNAAYNKFSYVPGAIRGEVAKTIEESGKWGEVGSFAYQTGMSMADFLFATGISGGNSALAMTIMGSGAAADTTLAAVDRGVDGWKAFTLGAVAGVAEAVTEKWSIETLLNPDLLRDGTLKYVVKNALVEGGEEGASDLINLFCDILIAGDKSEWQRSVDTYAADGMTEKEAFLAAFKDRAITLGLDVLGGAMSGGILSGGNALINVNNSKKMGDELGELDLDEDDIRTFIETGLESDPDSASYQLATEMQAKIEAGEALSNYDLARLYQANVQAIQEEDAADDAAEPEGVRLRAVDEEGDSGEVSAKKLLAQAKEDLKSGKITDEQFDAILDDVMHLEELEDGTSVKTFDTQPGINAQNDIINANVNGGTNYDNSQQRPAGSAVAQSAGGNTAPGGADLLHGGSQRYDGTGTPEQAGSLAGIAGQASAGDQAGAYPGRTEIHRRYSYKDLRTERLTSKQLGLTDGTDYPNNRIIPTDMWDESMSAKAEQVLQQTGKRVVYITGRLQFRGSGGQILFAKGAITEDAIIVQADHEDYSAEQIADHEGYHGLQRRFNHLTRDIVEHIRQRFTGGEFEQVLGTYIDQLYGVYKLDEVRSDAEYYAQMDAIMEEVIADARAGMNMWDAGAAQFTQTVNEFLEEKGISRKQEQENGTEQPTGPPAERHSLDEPRALSLPTLDDQDADIKKESTAGTSSANDIYLAAANMTEQEADEGRKLARFIDQVNRMIDKSIRSKRKYKIGKVSKNHAEVINGIMQQLKPGFDASEYELWIDGTSAAHIEDRHGESGQQDRSMSTEEAKMLIPWAAQNATGGNFIIKPDGSIRLSDRYLDRDGKRAPEISLEKAVGKDTVYVSECVPDSANKRIWITSAYIKKGSNGQMLNMEDPSLQPTPEAPFDGNATTDIVTPGSRTVKDRYSYAGENANTADLDALERAKQMQEAGVADETIRQQTGWHMGMDGKWRWEIDDSGMRYDTSGDLRGAESAKWAMEDYESAREDLWGHADMDTLEKVRAYNRADIAGDEAIKQEMYDELINGQYAYYFDQYVEAMTRAKSARNAPAGGTLQDYIDHPALFEAYPQLRNVTLRFERMGGGDMGYYSRTDNEIVLNTELRYAAEDTLVHEIQHAIQKAEGFARGSNEEYWQRRQDSEYPVKAYDAKIRDSEKQVDEIMRHLPENVAEQFREWSAMDDSTPEAMALMDELSDGPYGDLFEDYFMLTWGLNDMRRTNYKRGPRDLYRNTAGEIEARDAASRRNLTAEERRGQKPARGDSNTVFVEDFDELSFAEMDAEYGPQLQTYFDPDISSEEIDSNIHQVAQMESVTQITGEEFAKGETDLVTQVDAFFSQHGNTAFNPQLGDVVLDRRGIKDDIAHGIGRKKAAAFAAVPDVIERGLVVDFQRDWKGRGYDTAVVAAPITIGTEEHIAAIVLTRSNQTNRFYVHEVLTTENGASPFKTGARKGDPGGNTPSVFSILDRIRSVKNQGSASDRFSVDKADTSDANGLRENMTAKEKNILRGVETRLLRDIGGALGVTKFGDRNYLKSVIQGLSDAYLESGTIDQRTMDDLLEQAFRQGIVVDRELHDQYEEVHKYLRTVSITLDPTDRSNIADYPDFVKRMRGKVRIVNEGGLPVDSAWHELNNMAPELFPDSIAHPADQLVRMTEVMGSLQITEKSLGDYYGPMAGTYKKDAKAEFERAVWDSVGELRQIRRYEQERQQKIQEAEPAPTTPEEAMEAWTKLKAARKTYEKAAAKNLLTDEDEMAVGELLKGKMLPEHLDKDKLNVKGILAVYEAKQEYEQLVKLLAVYRRKVKAGLRSEADTYLETANAWKDKNIGLLYSRETMQRNVEDIVPDKKLAKRINERYFETIRDAEAAAVKMKEKYRKKVRNLKLSRKVQKGDLVSEAHAVQLYGEAMDNIRILEKARGRLKQRDGKSLEEWRGVVYKLWQENPGLDKVKIENAVTQMRQIYDELFQKMNEVRVRWGYEPVNYRQGYFPHFQPGNGDGIMAQFGRVLGIDTQVVALPTTINGLTHTFKPGIQWFGNAQERLGFNTAYDAVEGFDRYIEGVASVICQTENIQRLRALASQIRYRTSDEGIRKQVDAIYNDPTLTEDRKRALVEDVYKNGKFSLSRFVVELDEYTNLLANKKSMRDRTTESDWGRESYVLLKWLESRVGANMIGGNMTSALTNVIPLTQAGAQLSKKAMLQGMWDTLASYKTDDGIIDRSSFLTNRRGSEPLVKMWQQDYGLSDFLLGVLPRKITEKKLFQKTMKGAKTAYAPIKSVTAPTMGWIQEHSNVLMELIDSFTAGSIVRAAYHQNLKRGLSESEAMHQADIFASRVMAERSKGGMPTLFESKNPFSKLFTQFQLEVNNQWSEVFKDIPRSQREKGLGALALVYLQYFLGAWLFNNLYEKLIGRRPAMDPIDIVLDAAKDFASDDVSTTDALENLFNNVLEELPFSSALTLVGVETDGGRIPVSSGIPNIHTLVEAATNDEWAPEKRWKEAQDELNKLAYVIPPFGGNQISKIWKGVKAYIEGGSYSVDSAGNDILQYPVYNDESGDFWGLVQAMILGKSALPEAREWVEDGFDSLSARQTAAYQDMLATGVKGREAFNLLMELQGAEETNGKTRIAVQRDILRNSDISGDGKAIAYYGLILSDAAENERALMDRLAEAGADVGEVANVLMDIHDADSLHGAEASCAKRNAIINSTLTEEEKIAIYREKISESRDEDIEAFRAVGLDFNEFLRVQNQYATVNGKDANATAKATDLSRWVDDQDYTDNQAATIKDSFVYYNQIPASASRYDKFVDAGMDVDDAYDLTGALNELRPEEGAEQVSDLQKWRISVDFSDDVDDQLTALSAVMTDAQFLKVEIANDFGVSPDAYVTLHEIKSRYDSDGNRSYTNAEIRAAVDGLPGYYTTEQKAVLWQLVTGSTSAKNNPYSRQVGQQVLDAKAAANEAAAQEEELEGLTLGNW